MPSGAMRKTIGFSEWLNHVQILCSDADASSLSRIGGCKRNRRDASDIACFAGHCRHARNLVECRPWSRPSRAAR
jgi:hypothetical protein